MTVTVLNEDCIKGMENLPDSCVDLIVTDPPYNLGNLNGLTKIGNDIMSVSDGWGSWDTFTPADYEKFMMSYFRQCYRILKEGGSLYCFTSREDNGYYIHKLQDLGFTVRNVLSIVKLNPQPSFTKTNYRHGFELCFYMIKGGDFPKTFNFLAQERMINYFFYNAGMYKETKHPTEKPIDFIRHIIKVSSNEGDVVFDGFVGSGTTAAACKQLNRIFIGFEISPKYYSMIMERLQQSCLLSYL